jgi:hypothetical protein
MLHGTVLLVLTCATGWAKLSAGLKMENNNKKYRAADKSLAPLGRK